MSQIATTIEQSKRLLDAGLDPGSADMSWVTIDTPWRKESKTENVLTVGNLRHRSIPAWSLSRLWDICNDSGIGPFNFGGNSIESSEIVAKLVEWIIWVVHDYEVLDEYLNEETRQEQSHVHH